MDDARPRTCDRSFASRKLHLCVEGAVKAKGPLMSVALLPCNGAPGEIRTPDPRLRRPMLYPAELRAHKNFSNQTGSPNELAESEGFEPSMGF